MKGNFNVHVLTGKYNGVWTDLALEQTYNKVGKTTLFKGLTQNAATREKYIAAMPFLAAVSNDIQCMTDLDIAYSAHHHGYSKNLAESQTEAVNRIISTIKSDFINPYSITEDMLINICTGEKAQNNDIAYGWKHGIESLEVATSQQMDAIKCPKLQGFKSSTKIHLKKDIIRNIYSDQMRVMKTLCFVNDTSDTEKYTAFSHEWSNYPPALFEPSSSTSYEYVMRKGVKSDFIHFIESDVACPTTESPPNTNECVLLIDAMAFIQKYQTMGAKTFLDLQKAYLNQIFKMKPAFCKCIHFVADRYDFQNSLKADERNRRKLKRPLPAYEYSPVDTLSLPNWAIF